MDVVYCTDLSTKAFLDYGNAPQHAGELKCDEQYFYGLLWDLDSGLVVFIEMDKEENPDPETPMFKASDLYWIRGWIPQTYLWTPGEGGLYCHGRKINIEDNPEGDAEWEKQIYREILTQSIYLAMTPVGSY